MEWIDVKGYEDIYCINKDGVLKNKISGRVKKFTCNGNGYLRTNLTRNGKQKTKYQHVLLAEAFIDNPLNLKEVNHIDENKSNNTLINLEWVTRRQNMMHGTAIERIAEKISKGLLQFDLKGNLLNEFKNVREASKVTGIGEAAIYKCAVGKHKTSGGYRFKYVS